jgi:hypothetical protein
MATAYKDYLRSFKRIEGEYDSRLTPGIPLTLGQHGFAVPATVQPFDQESVERVRDWLSTAPKIRAPGWYSYGLKHVAEDAFGTYVANGDFIAAAIREGFIVRQERESPNAMIGVSAVWVKQQIARAKAERAARHQEWVSLDPEHRH